MKFIYLKKAPPILCLCSALLLFCACSTSPHSSSAGSETEAAVREIITEINPQFETLLQYYLRDGFILPEYALESGRSEPPEPSQKSIKVDGNTFYPIQNEFPRTLAELKQFTEQTVTPEFAARLFYSSIPDTLREIDGRIYIAQADFPGQLPILPTDNILVKEFTASRIKYEATDKNYAFLGENAHGTVVLLKDKSTARWRIDSLSIFFTNFQNKADSRLF